MKSAFFRLFSIAGGAVFTAAFVVFLINFTFPVPGPMALPREWQNEGPWILSSGDQEVAAPFSLKAYQAAISYDPRVIPYLPLRASLDREWFVLPSGPLEIFSTGVGAVERTTSADLRQLKLKTGEKFSPDSPISLKDFLRAISVRRLAFEVHSREIAAITFLLNDLKEFNLHNEILATSPNHLVLRELRKQRPLWWYSADASTLAQWNVFAALFMERFAPQSFDWLNVSQLLKPSSRTARELQRRQVPWLWQSDEFQNLPWPGRPWAILTNRPKSALQWKASGI